mmetsp:Transcript_22811/g.33807  ORF Transcript_22811/g.33807 Transcript_22811/m.33807 type:complete len:614 (+) Transcript_22811:97-1938(+)
MGFMNRNAIFGLIAGFALSNIIFSTQITTIDDFDQPAPTIYAATSPHGTETNGTIEVSSICDHLNGLSTFKIWNEHIHTIFQASRHSNDDNYAWHDFTAMLMKEITPRLPQSVKYLASRQQDEIGNILDVVFQRYQYVKHHQSSNITTNTIQPPRKLHILVAGGSVTRGMNCPEYPIDDGTHAHIFCAWPRRLKNLINNLFGEEIVEIHEATIGGMNTNIGTLMYEYALFRPKIPHPDIVINAFSTNDMHVASQKEAEENNVTLHDLITDMNQRFIRLVLGSSKGCRTPLLLYYDDYIGNEQKEIVATKAFTGALDLLASYYGIGYISFADAVKHIVYGDANEDWLSPNGWPERQIHPGRGMHISSAWFILYYFLDITTNYCDVKAFHSKHVHDIPNLKHDMNLTRQPLVEPKSQPPPLDNSLSLDNISSIWRLSDEQSNNSDPSRCPNSSDLMEDPCVFAWMSEISYAHSARLKRYMNRRIRANRGWDFVDDNRKPGFGASKPNASFSIELRDIDKQVKAINIVSMKSYDAKWRGSKVEMQVFVQKRGESTEDSVGTISIEGFHEKKTSESYPNRFVLPSEQSIQRGDNLRIEFNLVGGSTFKITGMMICDH